MTSFTPESDGTLTAMEQRTLESAVYRETVNLIVRSLLAIGAYIFWPLLFPGVHQFLSEIPLALVTISIGLSILIYARFYASIALHPDPDRLVFQLSLWLGTVAFGVSLLFSSNQIWSFIPFYASIFFQAGTYGLIKSLNPRGWAFYPTAFSMMVGLYTIAFLGSTIMGFPLNVMFAVRFVVYSALLMHYVFWTVDRTLSVYLFDDQAKYYGCIAPICYPFWDTCS